MYKGKPLKDDQVLTLAVNNYRYSSGLKANKIVAATKNWESPGAIRDSVADYIKAEGSITPEVSNNWEIIGVELDHPLKAEIVALVEAEKLEIPYNKSLNIQDLEAAGIIKDGKVIPPADLVDQDISHSEGPTKPKPTDPVKPADPVKPTEPVKPVEPPVKEPEKGTVIYVVKSGDYLIKIARMYGVNYRDIAKNNNIRNANLIFPNQRLEIVIQ